VGLGFDGALTMLGVIIGFLVSNPAELTVVINACLGAAIALGASGFSSAYVSELAERQRSLAKLEDAMISDLHQSAHGEAMRRVPLLIAAVNGASPLVISLLIIAPMWMSREGISLPVPAPYLSILVALGMIFLLGVFLGRIGNIPWFRSGIQTLLVAAVTAVLIYLLTRN